VDEGPLWVDSEDHQTVQAWSALEREAEVHQALFSALESSPNGHKQPKLVCGLGTLHALLGQRHLELDRS